jgi:hypothetical protein
MPLESSIFFTLKKNDFIGPGFRRKPIRHHSTIVIAVLEFEEIYGDYWRDKQPQLRFFIDTDVEMV